MDGEFIIILFVAAIFLATPVAGRICDERRSRKATLRHYAPPPREDANKAIQDAASARLLKGRADEVQAQRERLAWLDKSDEERLNHLFNVKVSRGI